MRAYYPHRDSQRHKVYAAEDSLVLDVAVVGSLRDAQRTVDRLLRSKRVQTRWPSTSTAVQIVGGARTRGTYFPRSQSIMLRADGTDSDYTLTHELAHHLTRHADEAHGWEFCATLLWLVRSRYGADVHDQLRAAFREHRVRYTAPRARRQLSDEQRVAASARLAAARAARAERNAAERGDWIIELQHPEHRPVYIEVRQRQLWAYCGSPQGRRVTSWQLRSSAQRVCAQLSEHDQLTMLRVVARDDALARFEQSLSG